MNSYGKEETSSYRNFDGSSDKFVDWNSVADRI